MRIRENQTWQGTKFERNATKCFVIIALISTLTLTASFYPQEKTVLSATNNPNFVAIHEKLSKAKLMADNHRLFRGKAEEASYSLFKFDPNSATQEELIRLGLSPKLAQTILNFRSKNGKFYKPEDLKKIYGFRSEDYERLKDYVVINFKEKEKNIITKSKKEATVEYFEFNPNKATKEELIRLGLTPRIAKRIVNYRSKGGKFKIKEDLKRIYDFTEHDYQRLEAYIYLPEIVEKKKIVKSDALPKTDFSKPIKKANIKIDINQSTVEDWQKLNGIGPKYAHKILNFRSKLGGFSSIEQVGTTYYFPDSVFQKVKPFLVISPILKKVNVNKASKDDFSAHPYINWKQAKGLIAYRKQHGTFENMADLKKIYGIFTEEDWARLEPYLAF